MKMLFVFLTISCLIGLNEGLSCSPCDPSLCPAILCKGGTELGICNCCNVCLKQKGETCAGPFNFNGSCDENLFCELDLSDGVSEFNASGVCISECKNQKKTARKERKRLREEARGQRRAEKEARKAKRKAEREAKRAEREARKAARDARKANTP